MPKLNRFMLSCAFILTACGSDPLMNPYGGTAEDQLNNANIEMTQYSTKPTAEMVAVHNVENAIKEYRDKNDTVGLGNAYHTYGKIYKVFERSGQKDGQYQRQAISYYQQTNYNPGLAVAYGELMQAYFVQGNKEEACKNGLIAIEKYETAKTTHPGINIPVYSKNTNDFGEFVKIMRKQQGCVN